jgi:hypothetical protein
LEKIIRITREDFYRSHLRRLRQEQAKLRATDQESDLPAPKLLFVTATFVPIEEAKPNAIPIPASTCLEAFEQFYVRGFLSKLIGHYGRPNLRDLQPLAFAFIDYPFSKRKKSYATLPQFEQSLKKGRLAREHPETTPHIHALMVLHPRLVEKFEAKRSEFEPLFRSLRPTNRTLDIQEIAELSDDAVVLAYSTEILKKPQHPDLKDVDLFTWLPKAPSEPNYQKQQFEKELEEKLWADRLLKERHTAGVLKFANI